MASDVSICSAALLLLGDEPITSLTEDTRRAEICNGVYSLAKDSILRLHPWNCLTVRVALSPLSAAPVSGWAYQFSKPSNLLRVLKVADSEDNQLDYRFEANRILANTDTIYLHYVERKTESNWDSNLVDVMIKRMELDLAYPITKSTSLRDALRQEFYAQGVGVLAQAKSVDGQENPPEDYGDSPFITVRG